jgi:cysteine-rich repeat protein
MFDRFFPALSRFSWQQALTFVLFVGILSAGFFLAFISPLVGVERIQTAVDNGTDPDHIAQSIGQVIPLGPAQPTDPVPTGAFCGDATCDADESFDTCALDCFACNANGRCDADIGENPNSCPVDCGSVSTGTCDNDGVCDLAETTASCPQDCASDTGSDDAATPPPTQVCGNNKIEGTETCDTNALNSKTCITQGFSGGTLSCNGTCTGFNTTACTSATCGNNLREGTELCDGSDLNSQTCATRGFTSGTLFCQNTCSGFNTNSCTRCGNGLKETGETCDDGGTSNGNGCSSTCFIEPGYACTGAPSVCQPTAQNESPLGINVDGFTYWSTEMPLKNIVHQNTGWKVNWAGGTVGFDAQGYPLSLATNQAVGASIALSTSMVDDYPTGHYPTGHYVARYDGSGTLSITGDAKNVAKISEGRYEFDVPNATSGGIYLQITATDPANHLRNIRMMLAAYESVYPSDQWDPIFLNRIKSFNTIRFMNWMLNPPLPVTTGYAQGATTNTITLASTASAVDNYYVGMTVQTNAQGGYVGRLIGSYNGSTKVATMTANWDAGHLPTSDYYTVEEYAMRNWSNRTQDGNFTLGLGTKQSIPIEMLVDLSNKAHANPWVNMPAEATDDYVRQFAIYMRDHLDSDRKIYLEYANEYWNGGYPGARWSEAKGAEWGIDYRQYAAYRSVQVFRIWNDVFNEPHLRTERGSSRLVWFLSAQTHVPSTGPIVMDYNGQGIPTDANSPFGPGKKAADYADAFAITNYLGNYTTATFDSSTVDQIIDLIDAEITTKSSSGGAWVVNVQNARSRGLDVVVYEAGINTTTDTGAQPLSAGISGATTTTADLNGPVWAAPSGTDDAYNGRMLTITGGTGKGQSRKISDYDGATHRATVESAWTTVPDGSSSAVVQIERHYKETEVNRSPRMKDIYLRVLNAWKGIGLDANGRGPKLWNQFSHVGPYNRYGRLTMFEYFDQDPATAYKWLGAKEFIDNNPKWWTD